MTWLLNEVVRSGNNTARVKNYYPDTGLLVLYDINGSFGPGSAITGDDSGTQLTFSTFELSAKYDLEYDPDSWESLLEKAIYDGNGNLVALDKYFTGKPSQDYQTTYLVVID